MRPGVSWHRAVDHLGLQCPEDALHGRALSLRTIPGIVRYAGADQLELEAISLPADGRSHTVQSEQLLILARGIKRIQPVVATP